MQFNPMTLEGKRILITGASSGIGQATAKVISKLGANVILLARNEERLKYTLESLEGNGHSFYSFDLSNIDEIPALIKRIAHEQGALSGLFHSAGIEIRIAVNMLKKKYIDSVFSSSIMAALLLTRAFCQKNVRTVGTGSIVFMSSVASITGKNGLSTYSASKGAIDSAMRSLACELAGKSVRVNTVAAGAVQTEMMMKIAKTLSIQSLEDYRSRHLLGFGSPYDVANAVAFLLSDASNWVTGTVMVVDGGYCCQ